MLGVTLDQLSGYFGAIAANQPVPPRALPDRSIDVSVLFDQKKRTTPNVVAYLPGSDPVLKDEYVVISSHHDHLNVREGHIFSGADDNASGSVAMLTIAKAMMVERPRRSVIFVWHTAEERGLVGAYYFVQHCPVPVEKITANLNLDMITRNNPNGIYLIGSNKISSEFDKSLKDVNAASVKLTLDYKYEDPGEPNRFFFRSDQYPYMRYGIPGVWIFCGTTPDYHTERDVEERVDYAKMEKITRLTYLVAMDVGNRPALLVLDLHPEIKTRGAHNMKVVWQRPAQTR
jgi:Zn-dependent M28 family amino/carboxypeptidase